MQIKDKIEAVEKESGVKVLMASEAGARAWGVESRDSGYDIRFIYASKIEHYLSFKRQQNTMELPMDAGLIEMNGWDINKALGWMWKSNAPLFEWIHSPIIYYADHNWLHEFKSLSVQYFSPMAVFFHYFNIGATALDFCRGPQYNLNELFYALRALTAAKWVAEQQTLPPVVLDEILEGINMPREVKDGILFHKQLKAQMTEPYAVEASEIIRGYMLEVWLDLRGKSEGLSGHQGGVEALDKFYRNTIL